MLATAFAAISPFQMILFGKNYVPFRTFVKIFGFQFLCKHLYKDTFLGVFIYICLKRNSLPKQLLHSSPGPIGVFDSGYGGLTVLKEIIKEMPEYDYVYLGDNARAPYGTRDFETVYAYTLQCVKKLFEMGCHLVILACNTASAKALRNIQQKDLPLIDPGRRVLGVIRPTAESISTYTQTKKVGVLGTRGTVSSESYPIEIKKLFPEIEVYQHACPMWVPLIENNEHESEGADYFIKKDMQLLFKQNKNIDAVILACTHYPLIKHKIEKHLPQSAVLVSQGELVAKSLKNYLGRHPEMEIKCTKGSDIHFYTTESEKNFAERASLFFEKNIHAKSISVF